MAEFFITTPIYYVNDEPHIGHAYTTILADVLARYRREAGDDVFFLTGTDEHGQKVYEAARKRGIEPEQHCDQTVVRFKALWQKLHIQYDHFIRTTDDEHKEVVQNILRTIHGKGDIYFDEYSGLYCVGCERFYTEKELDKGKCPQHKKEVKEIKETNYFFQMSKYQQQLIDYIHDHPGFIQPDFRRNEVLGFLRRPLGDLCISRPKSRLSWGIELPFDKDYVTYVWFDALINYISAVGATRNAAQFNRWWPANYHLIGKDILTTHAVYWPTMLFAADLPQPKTIFAHGWWLSDDFKMSKSLGNVVKPLDLVDEYGVDPVRYFLMRDMVLGQDASFSLEAFVRRYNSDLANDLGNLVGRISTLIRRHFDGRIPEATEATAEDSRLRKEGESITSIVDEWIEAMQISKAVEGILKFVRIINRYMERMEPWKLVKSNRQRSATVLYHAAESLRLAAQLLHPIMPSRMERILDMISDSQPDFSDRSWGKLRSGMELGQFEVPFPRIELSARSASRPSRHRSGGQLSGEKSRPQKVEEKKMSTERIAIDDFAKVELKTAEVIQAEKVEGTDKLLKLQIEVGDEQRQIVAGIAEYYAPEDLVGRIIVVVTNLQPAVIRGAESNGMLLAATAKDSVVLVTLDDPSIGSGVRIS